MGNESTALARAEKDGAVALPEYDGLVMVVSPAEALRRMQELQAFVKAAMVAGLDYGTIPGTDKPSLYQPGAQKLEEIYGFSHTFEDVARTEEWERGFFFYCKRAVLTSRRDGRYISDGIGSCNSKEGRYAYRWVFDNELPAGVDKATLKSETKTSKKNGRPYTRFRLPNEDIFSLVNTLEKMACKRALVHAVIGATRSAGVFTQDVEDIPREAFGTADDTRSWEKPGPARAPLVPISSDEINQKADALDKLIEGASTVTAMTALAKAMKDAALPDAIFDALKVKWIARGKEIKAAERAAAAGAKVVNGDERDYSDEGP